MNPFIPLLILQDYAVIISMAAGVLVVAVVIFLMATSSIDEDKDSAKHKTYKLRGQYFFGLILVLIIFLFISLRFLPYQRFQNNPDEEVTVVGMQWSWKMAPGISDKTPADFAGTNEISLPVNKRIEFVVTSADVNHDFGIYNSKGVLLAQTQAMPGYHNKLQYEFTQKGDYSILCLEYCGLAHSFMMGTIHVN
ncbi:MAG TPA: hypothetical protein VFI29_00070 [Hanamia sp.]|nr:hypothetical protein [Hanamia sp.]